MSPQALAALHAACLSTPRPWSAAEFTELMAMSGVFLIARPHGFALGRVVLDEAELLTLAVDPNHRRAGLGRACLAAFEAEGRMRGATRAFLEVAQDNRPARALYADHGYRFLATRRGYYRDPDGQPIDALVMERALGET